MAEFSTRFVVGLGNPGKRYERTRHNLGFQVVDALVRRWNAPPPRQAFSGLLWDASFQGRRVMLLEPQTFMNLSGQAVGELARFYKAAAGEVMVVLDDMALPPGQIRLRAEGSAGGHHGLADVVRALGTIEVPRLRVGIGSPPPRMAGADYVLGLMTEEELAAAKLAEGRACLAIETWLASGIDVAMNLFNRCPDIGGSGGNAKEK